LEQFCIPAVSVGEVEVDVEGSWAGSVLSTAVFSGDLLCPQAVSNIKTDSGITCLIISLFFG
jgi:hypothetical protein